MRWILWLFAVLLLCSLTRAHAAGLSGSPGSDQAFDVSAQSAALRPAFQNDLRRAGEWNRYLINATIDPQARTLAGRQQLEYTNRDTVALDQIYFHLYPNLSDFGGQLDINAIAVDGQEVSPVYEAKRYLLRVDLPQPLAPAATTSITLDFVTRTPENGSRAFYGAFNKEAGVLALASAMPIVAIVRDGAWDVARPDPKGDFVNSETALYDVTLTVSEGWNLAATGVEVERQAANGQQTVRLVSGPQRDFTIALNQLTVASAEVDGTRVNSYYRSGSAAGGRRALDVAVKAIRAYNARYGAFPLAELDIVELNCRSFYGVEYPGLIMIEHQLYRQSKLLETTVAHEVGHQWWYSVIGNDVQREAWLDEGFASYSQVLYYEQIGNPQAAAAEIGDFRQQYLALRAAGRDGPVAQPTSAFRRNYNGLVYAKAALFLQALRGRIGEGAFDRFLHDYYAQHRYGYIGGDALLASAEAACGCELDTLYRDWISSAVPVKVP